MDFKATKKLLNHDYIFSVSEYLDFLNKYLEPCRAIIQGEIGERIYQNPRYSYFNLLDKENSVLKCFVWNWVLKNLGLSLKSGTEVKVIGYPSIYKRTGEFSFQVERIELVGEGMLKKQYEALKIQLEKEGYFAPERKKPLPMFSEKIGLITSKYGDGAKNDFLKHLDNFGFEIYFFDARMEGSLALREIISAIEWFNKNMPNIDVIALIRGGGDWESLKAFNTREIVEAIVASRIPILTGIGHEADYTLADFAADFRASTPTHAAKKLSEDWQKARVTLKIIKNNLKGHFYQKIRAFKKRINEHFELFSKILGNQFLKKELLLKNFQKNLNYFFKNHLLNFEKFAKNFKNNFLRLKIINQNRKKETLELAERLEINFTQWYKKLKISFAQEERKLFLSNPELKLKQGYTITRDLQGKILKDASLLKKNQRIFTKFGKGAAFSVISKLKTK